MSHSSANGTQPSAPPPAASTSQGAGQSLMYGALLRRFSQDLPPSLLGQEREQRARLLALAGGGRDSNTSPSTRRRCASSSASSLSSTFSDFPYDQRRASLIPLAGSRVVSEGNSRRSSGCCSDLLLDSDPNATHAHNRDLVDGVALDTRRLPSEPTNMAIDEQQQQLPQQPNAGFSTAASQLPLTRAAAAAAGNLFRGFVSRLVAHMNSSSPERRQPGAEREALDQLALETVAEAASALLDEEIDLIARVYKLFWRQSLFRVLAVPRSLLAIAGIECAEKGDESAAAAAVLSDRFPSAPETCIPSGSADLPTRMSVSEAEGSSSSASSSPHWWPTSPPAHELRRTRSLSGPPVATARESQPQRQTPTQSQSTTAHASSESDKYEYVPVPVPAPISLESLTGRAEYRLYTHMLDDMRQNEQLVDLVLFVPGARIRAHYQALARVFQYTD